VFIPLASYLPRLRGNTQVLVTFPGGELLSGRLLEFLVYKEFLSYWFHECYFMNSFLKNGIHIAGLENN
jgi:hypothetical protein